ncbi:MAG TPA: GDSL-type esterase/lipase family protein [Ruminiclostridium sp.]|nr:GDSL-type esterase/lipase family protein [Ruminiclostridium sp.]
MSSNKKNKHHGLKGNTLLVFITVLLGVAVVASALMFYDAVPVSLTASGTHKVSSSSSSASSAPKTESSAKNESSSKSTSSKTVSAPADLTKALFVGDSLTAGLSIYGNISGDNIVYTNGLTAYSALNKKVTSGSTSETVAETAETKKPAGIYIMLGANDIAQGYSVKKFTSNYASLIDKLKTSCPDAKIYVESILPVTSKYEQSSSITNEKVDSFNASLKTLCGEKSVIYCDIASELKGSDGMLSSNLSGDGYHLKKEGYDKWISYLKTN